MQKRSPGGTRCRCALFTRSGSLCETAHFLISTAVFAACQHSRSFLLFPLCGLTWHLSFTQPSLSFTHIYNFLLTDHTCRPLKICNITIRVFVTQPRQEPQSEGIKLSKDFPSHIVYTFEQHSPQYTCMVGLLTSTAPYSLSPFSL